MRGWERGREGIEREGQGGEKEGEKREGGERDREKGEKKKIQMVLLISPKALCPLPYALSSNTL